LRLSHTETASRRVLVVDDHVSDRRVIHRYLNSWEMPNDGASSAPEALKLLQDALEVGAPYDIALIDYIMPGMDGLEVARILRADPRFDALRLVMLTAHDQRDLCSRALEVGFAACLGKPVRQSQLFDSLVARYEPEDMIAVPLIDSLIEPSLANPENLSNNRRLILLAEDNLVNQKVAQLQVNKLGYALHIVDNGQKAVEALTAAHHGQAPDYAAILMDCQMPVMDGFEATVAIRIAQAPDRKRIPIIAMTANAMQGDRDRCLTVGMDDYLSKPIKPEELRLALEKWVGTPLIEADVVPPAAVSQTSGHSVVSAQSPVIDFELLDDYFGDDPLVVTKLLTLFQSTTTVLLAKLETSIGARDRDAIFTLAHELRGSCGNIGIERMSNITAQLEDAAAELDWKRTVATFDHLRTGFDDVVAAIAAHQHA
jgi:CheY-like chemotaxis protein